MGRSVVQREVHLYSVGRTLNVISSNPIFNKEGYFRSSRTENSLFFLLEIGCRELEKT